MSGTTRSLQTTETTLFPLPFTVKQVLAFRVSSLVFLQHALLLTIVCSAWCKVLVPKNVTLWVLECGSGSSKHSHMPRTPPEYPRIEYAPVEEESYKRRPVRLPPPLPIFKLPIPVREHNPRAPLLDKANALLIATITGNTRAVTKMLEEDTMLVNGRGDFGCTALYKIVNPRLYYEVPYCSHNRSGYAPDKKRTLAMVRLLLDHGASPDLKVDGYTPLFWASDVEIVSLLLERGADPSNKCSGDWTPLMDACQYGWTEGVRRMLLSQPDLDVRNKFGETAPWLACTSGNRELCDLMATHAQGRVDYTTMADDARGVRLLHCRGDACEAQCGQMVKWWKTHGHLYVLFKARRIHELQVQRAHHPDVPPPAYLPRATHTPTVEIENKGLQFVVEQLCTELFHELCLGMAAV